MESLIYLLGIIEQRKEWIKETGSKYATAENENATTIALLKSDIQYITEFGSRNQGV